MVGVRPKLRRKRGRLGQLAKLVTLHAAAAWTTTRTAAVYQTCKIDKEMWGETSSDSWEKIAQKYDSGDGRRPGQIVEMTICSAGEIPVYISVKLDDSTPHEGRIVKDATENIANDCALNPSCSTYESSAVLNDVACLENEAACKSSLSCSTQNFSDKKITAGQAFRNSNNSY